MVTSSEYDQFHEQQHYEGMKNRISCRLKSNT